MGAFNNGVPLTPREGSLSGCIVKMPRDGRFLQDKISISRNRMQGPVSAFLEVTFIGAYNDKSIQSQ